MEQLFISLAYKYVMLTLMLADVNHALEKLDVPGWEPVTMSQIVNYNISPPRMRAGGSLDTTSFFFGFGENKMQFLQRTEPDSDLNLRERQAHWSKMISLIGTNEAYQLATNWLSKLDVDLDALENAHPVTVQQQFYPNGDTKEPPVMLPRFEVRWGRNQSLPAVWVSIFGPTKTPIHIRQEDGSFIRRANLVKTESIESLLSITNKEFAGWTVQQKSNLVVQSAGNIYSSMEFPEVFSKVSVKEQTRLQPVTDTQKTNNAPHRKTKTLPPLNQKK